ncbi:MAG: 4-hydroxybenzoate octaprenyltransferase [Chloroflexi bacterium]|nr:4-hydroxybenzoate octaprenyltransferase [Chloroflexota bacterium]
MLIAKIITKIKILSDSIRFQETIFTLPFAFIGSVIASRGIPELTQILWITLALTGGRTLGMACNRIIDIEQDKLNPRTQNRALVTGDLKKFEVGALAFSGLILLFISAYMLNPLALLLSPIAAIFVFSYSYFKRFTWGSHFAIGITDSVAPIGGWIAITGTFDLEALVLGGAVACWVSGFDIFYSAQDMEFDRVNNLNSIPQKFGLDIAFNVSRLMHISTSILILLAGVINNLHMIYYLGWGIATLLLLYEHSIISPKDMSRMNVAFFKVNGYIGIILLIFTIISFQLTNG